MPSYLVIAYPLRTLKLEDASWGIDFRTTVDNKIYDIGLDRTL